MSGREHVDKAKTKPGDVKAATAEMVRLTVEEQRRCRIEGFRMAMRVVDREYESWWFETWENRRPCDVAEEIKGTLILDARRRWGEAFGD